MKTGRYVNSKRRKFRKTKKTLYIKSRKNTRKIMKGGTSEVIGKFNIAELDKVGLGDNKIYKNIYISKTFDTESEAKEFITMAKGKIGEEGVGDDEIKPNMIAQVNTKTTGWWPFKKNKTVNELVPTSYTAYFKTNTEHGIELAKQMIKDRPQIVNADGYDPDVVKKQEKISVF
jgi:hypothetical protein